MPFYKMNPTQVIAGFDVQGALMRYNVFAARLYNWCLSLGFKAGHIMPSRAFCSDENQGYPIIMLTKHFGTFPFNHGRVGGIVSHDRHGPHAEHGEDLVIIQASHVGYDPDRKHFGSYCRLQTHDRDMTPTCGKIDHVIGWYRDELAFARNNITVMRDGTELRLVIDNQLLKDERVEGLFLHLDKMVARDEQGLIVPLRGQSTSKIFAVTEAMAKRIERAKLSHGDALGEVLAADLFYFKHNIEQVFEGSNNLERNLIDSMPLILTSSEPMLTAALVNTQIEFDRTYRSIVRAECYKNKRLLFISGIHIDISPQEDHIFPFTKFVPWAAYIQDGKGGHKVIEQRELVDALLSQSSDNPHQIDLEAAMEQMASAKEIMVEMPMQY